MYDRFIEKSAVVAALTSMIQPNILRDPMTSPYGVKINCPAAYDAKYDCDGPGCVDCIAFHIERQLAQSEKCEGFPRVLFRCYNVVRLQVAC